MSGGETRNCEKQTHETEAMYKFALIDGYDGLFGTVLFNAMLLEMAGRREDVPLFRVSTDERLP